MMYYSDAVETFKDSNVIIGQLPISNVIPLLKTNDSDAYTKTILGLRFKPIQTKVLVYLGSEQLLDNFVIPNLGSDYTIYSGLTFE